MASGSHKEEEQLLKELATKEVTIYLDATYCNGEWTLRMRKRNRRARTSSQVYANQLNVHLDLSEGDVVMSGSADWLAVARAANDYFKGPRAGSLLQPTNELALGPRISLPRSSRSALPPPRDESVEAKQDNRRAHNGGNSTKKRKVPDITVEDSEEFNETMRRYRDKKAAKTRQAIAARTDARHQVMLDSLPSDEMRQLVIERRPRDEKDNIPFWDTVRWARKVGDAVERRRGKRPQYEVWKAKLERAVRLKRTVELIRVDASTDHKGDETPAERKRASVVGAGAVTHLTHKALALYQLYDLLLQGDDITYTTMSGAQEIIGQTCIAPRPRLYAGLQLGPHRLGGGDGCQEVQTHRSALDTDFKFVSE